MAITATEIDLLACFGVEPVPSEAGKPWPYVDSTYTTEADGLKVTFKVHPSYKDVELVAAQDGRSLYELKAVGVEDVRVLDLPGCDVLEIRLSRIEWLRVRLRPGFGIIHGFERLPPWTGVAQA